MLEVGTRAPDFKLSGNDGATHSLGDLLAGGSIILYFYPADFTPGCTKEACAIRDLHTDIQNTGLRVVGVSPQDTDSHQRFAERYDLPFLLLADDDKLVTKAYDLNGPLGIGTRRGTFLINRDQVIDAAVLADIRIEKHIEFIQQAMARQNADATS